MKRIISIVVCLICVISFSNAQVVINPIFDRSDVAAFRVQKVEITKDTTFVYCSYSAEAESWANISKDMYLFSIKNSKKYPLLRCVGLPYAPQQKTFRYDECIDVLLCFPSVDRLSRFDIIENEGTKAFNIYGVDITKQYNVTYRETEVSRFANMASFYDSARDTLKAIHFMTKEIEATKYINGVKSEPLIVTLLNGSLMYDKYEYYDEAIDLAKQKEILHKELWGTSDWNWAIHLRTFGQLFSHARRYDEAILKYKEAIDIFESNHIVDNEYAKALRFAAEAYYQTGDSERALSCKKKNIKVLRQIGDPVEYYSGLYNLLLSSIDVNQRIDIVEQELKSLPACADSNSIFFAEIYKQLASEYSFIAGYKNAIDYCDKAIRVLEINNMKWRVEYAESWALKCRFQRMYGMIDEAISSGDKAKQLYNSLNVRSAKYVELLRDLASAYDFNLNYEKSIQLLTEAIEINIEIKDSISLADAYHGIGSSYQFSEKLDEAEKNTKKAINILDELKNFGQTNDSILLYYTKQRIMIIKSGAYSTLARIYEKRGNYVDAIKAELKSGELIQADKGNQGYDYASHLETLSEYYSKNNQLEEAKECCEQCIRLLNDNNVIKIVQAKVLLAFINFQMGDIKDAIRNTEEVTFLSKTIDYNYGRDLAKNLLSFLYLKNNDIIKAEKCLSEELDDIICYINTQFPQMNAEQRQRLWDNFEICFLRYRHIIERSNRNSALLIKLYDYILFSKNLLLNADIQKSTDGNTQMKIEWKDIQKSLSNDDIAIEFIRTNEDNKEYNTYHALVIDKNSDSPQMITLFSESELEKKKKTDTRDISVIVGESIWQPILAHYGSVKNIYFSADGALHLLPIEYYNVGDINMFEHYNMYRLSSTKEVIKRNRKNVPSKAVLYGGLDYTGFKAQADSGYSQWRGIAARGGFEPLYNTFAETEDIEKLLVGGNISVTSFTGDKGTEESFRNLSNNCPNIIHLATHGMYIAPEVVDEKRKENNFAFLESIINEKDPVKEDIALTHSFLVLSGGNSLIQRNTMLDSESDGILTAKDISRINLNNLDLVVLSACESALGDMDNEGVYGLQRGFKKAGANTILMSLAKVDDEATKILMVEFYRNLMNGKTKHESLQEAQKHLREVENGKYNNPKYWASFIMLDGLD